RSTRVHRRPVLPKGRRRQARLPPRADHNRVGTIAMTTADSRLFCSKPFTWFEVSRGTEEGDVFLCCPSWLDTPVGNLTRQTVGDVWNGEVAQDIRRSILDGSFEYCDAVKCPY